MNREVGPALDNTAVERLLSQELTSGQQYVYGPDNIAAERDRNYDYRRGIMRDMPAAAGRSAVTDRTVGAYIDLMKPSLHRIFLSGRNIGEYVTPKAEMGDVVGLATRYVNDVVIRKDNRGELFISDWSEDALVQKLGTVMGWWEERHEARDETLENITDAALPALLMEVEARGDEITAHTATDVVVDTDFGPVASAVHSLTIRTWVNKSKLCVDVIPPEEYVISRDARNDEDAIVEAHGTGVEIGYLLAEMPSDAAEIVRGLPTFSSPYPDRNGKYNQDGLSNGSRDQSADQSLRKVAVWRGRVRCNYDGTGIKDWFFVAGGDLTGLKLLQNLEPYNYQIFFANFCPQPLPHTVYGRCPADDLAEIQRIRTVAQRQMLDSFYLAVTPQREVVANLIIKPDQLMNLAPGAPVLVKAANAIREISIPFVGREALGVLQYYEGEAELRTGVGRNTAGLDPESLSNQSATANANMHSAMQGRIEQIARVWAHGGMRKLFRGILNCLIAYQDFARVVQIDGKPETIDPRQWEGLQDIDVNINTGLGTGNRERDFAILSQIDADQEKIFGFLGPGNPVVTLEKIVRTKQLKAEAAGISYPENFYGEPKNPDGTPWVQEPSPPQPSPDTMVFAEVENQKIAQKADEAAKQLAFEREKAIAEIASKERVEMHKINVHAAIEAEKNQINRGRVMVDAAKVDAGMIASDMKAARTAGAAMGVAN